jgi:hypothetical protein
MYGDWAQYQQRVREAERDSPGVLGVDCPHEPGTWMCGPCDVLADEWIRRHGLVLTEDRFGLDIDVARAVAGQ